MHIGFFTDGFTPQLNGVATSLKQVREALEALGHKVTVVAPAMGSYVDRCPMVIRLPSILALQDPPLWLAWPVAPRSLQRVLQLDLDVVHLHTPFALQVTALIAARRLRRPLVYTYHTLLPAHVRTARLLGRYTVSPKLAERYSVFTCQVCDHIIAPSEKVRDLLQGYGVRRPISVIHNGIDVRAFQGQARGYLRRELGLEPEAQILLTVGRLTQEKNVAFMVEALARLVALCPRAYLVLAGQGPLRSALESQAAALDIGKHLRCLGPRPHAEMPRVYADADVYVTASLSEAHSIAVLEALASGLPLVVVPDQSLALAVEEGVNGFVAPLDSSAFAERIARILRDPALATRMRAASSHLADRFSAQAQARAQADFYARLCRAAPDRR